MYKVVPYAEPCEYPDLETPLDALVTMLKEAFDARAHKKVTKTLKQIMHCLPVMQRLLHKVRENQTATLGLSLKVNDITASAIEACFWRDKVKQKRALTLYKQFIVACMALYKE